MATETQASGGRARGSLSAGVVNLDGGIRASSRTFYAVVALTGTLAFGMGGIWFTIKDIPKKIDELTVEAREHGLRLERYGTQIEHHASQLDAILKQK